MRQRKVLTHGWNHLYAHQDVRGADAVLARGGNAVGAPINFARQTEGYFRNRAGKHLFRKVSAGVSGLHLTWEVPSGCVHTS